MADQIEGPERKEIQDRTSPPAYVVYEAIRREGENELRRSSWALIWSGLAAGLSMGFSLVAEGLLRAGLPKGAPWVPLISKLGYSVGFLIVILGRQQLFTENTLTPILPLLRRPGLRIFFHVMRLWIVVLLANLVGAFLFAWAIGNFGVFDPGLRHTFSLIGYEAIAAGFWTILVRAVFAGWLVALVVWLLPMAESGRIMVIVVITYVIGLAHFSHVIAGSVETFYIVTNGTLTWSQWFLGFFFPTLLGNILGGVALVAAINHGQVVSGGDKEPIDL